ncbi:hypothetical protein OQA88_317 [Cercophora sp. LCS_1]
MSSKDVYTPIHSRLPSSLTQTQKPQADPLSTSGKPTAADAQEAASDKDPYGAGAVPSDTCTCADDAPAGSGGTKKTQKKKSGTKKGETAATADEDGDNTAAAAEEEEEEEEEQGEVTRMVGAGTIDAVEEGRKQASGAVKAMEAETNKFAKLLGRAGDLLHGKGEEKKKKEASQSFWRWYDRKQLDTVKNLVVVFFFP